MSLTTNALGLARTAHALADAGLDRVNVSLDTRATARPSATITRRDRLARRARRPRGRPATPGSARSRSTPCCCAASTTTRRPSCCAGPRPRLRAALHRADAARRPARLEPRRRWSPPTRSSTASSASSTLTPAERAAGQRPGRAVPRRRRPGDGRRDRLGHPARSAATATGSGSPPTARSATACSPARSPTCAPRCAPAPTDEEHRRPLGGRDARQARRPRHRRPDVPPARPADVRHRRLSRLSSASGRSRRRRRRPCRNPRAPRKSRERLPVLVAGQPDLAALRGVQLGVVPEQRPRRAAPGSPWPSRCRRLGIGVAHARLASLRRRRRNGSGAGQPRGKPSGTTSELGRGRPSSRRRFLSRRRVKSKMFGAVCRAVGSGAGVELADVRTSASQQLEAVGLDADGVGHHHGDVRQDTAPTIRTQRSQPWADRRSRRRSRACGCAIEMT